MRTCLFLNKNSILNLSLYKRSRENRHSEIYSGLILIFAIFLNYKIAGVKVFYLRLPDKYSILFSNPSKNSAIESLFKSKNDENRERVTKNLF